jgi:hypothetical protein
VKNINKKPVVQAVYNGFSVYIQTEQNPASWQHTRRLKRGGLFLFLLKNFQFFNKNKNKPFTGFPKKTINPQRMDSLFAHNYL